MGSIEQNKENYIFSGGETWALQSLLARRV